MTTTTTTITPPTTTPAPTSPIFYLDDHGRAVDTLSAAFHRDPVFEWIYPDASHRRAAVPHFFTVIVEQFASRHEVRTTPDVDGAALWLPPGEELFSEAAAETIIAELVEGAGPAAGRLMECFEILDAHHPHEPHWYLGFLGVQPALQGLGLGSSLLRATLVGVDEAGEAAYLEATSGDNRRLYERHGFEVVRELPMPDGPSLFAMWREPRTGGRS
jgi:ribosomal protein S18 acetylase RimI-like enzyme